MAFSMRSRSGEGKDAAMNLASGSQREKEAASAEGCERHCAASVARTAKANAETPGSPYYNANANAYRKLDQPCPAGQARPRRKGTARSRLPRWRRRGLRLCCLGVGSQLRGPSPSTWSVNAAWTVTVRFSLPAILAQAQTIGSVSRS